MDERHDRGTIVDRLLTASALGFVGGILATSWLGTPGKAFVAVAIVSLVGISVLYHWWGSRAVVLGVLFICAGSVGVARLEIGRPLLLPMDQIGQQVSITGRVVDDPFENGGKSTLTVKAKHTGVIRVSGTATPNLVYGDTVSVTGTLELPANFATDTGMMFDYVSYLYAQRIKYQIRSADIELVSRPTVSPQRALYSIRHRLEQAYRAIFSSQQAAFLSGITLGQRAEISSEFRSDLVATGTIHMVALSGQNVSMVAVWFREILSAIPGIGSGFAAGAGFVGIICFVLMTGAQASAVRAGIMAAIAILGRVSGRRYDATRALSVAVIIMLIVNPLHAFYDVSFQLSAMATLGILYLSPIFSRLFARIPKRACGLPLREICAVTLAAEAAVAPLILYKMGTLSLVSFFANIAIAPAVALAMAFGILSGLIALVSPLLALPLAWITGKLLVYITAMVTMFARVPHVVLGVSHVPLVVCALLYGALLLLASRHIARRESSTYNADI